MCMLRMLLILINFDVRCRTAIDVRLLRGSDDVSMISDVRCINRSISLGRRKLCRMAVSKRTRTAKDPYIVSGLARAGVDVKAGIDFDYQLVVSLVKISPPKRTRSII